MIFRKMPYGAGDHWVFEGSDHFYYISEGCTVVRSKR